MIDTGVRGGDRNTSRLAVTGAVLLIVFLAGCATVAPDGTVTKAGFAYECTELTPAGLTVQSLSYLAEFLSSVTGGPYYHAASSCEALWKKATPPCSSSQSLPCWPTLPVKE